MVQVDLLIAILLDRTSLFSDRHDAAMQLGSLNDLNAINGLFQVAPTDRHITDQDEKIIIEACGESLAQIWVHSNSFDKDKYQQLHPYAKEEAKAYLEHHKSEWII